MSSWARKGVKCICIDPAFIGGSAGLVAGQVYTIAKMFRGKGSVGPYKTGVVVVLEGLQNPFSSDGAFSIARFRPIITKTQAEDVALFHKIITTIPAGIEA